MGDLSRPAGRSTTPAASSPSCIASADDGKDGRVHIEFYGKAAANPLVRLAGPIAQGRPPSRAGDPRRSPATCMPRLIQARAKAGSDAHRKPDVVAARRFQEGRVRQLAEGRRPGPGRSQHLLRGAGARRNCTGWSRCTRRAYIATNSRIRTCKQMARGVRAAARNRTKADGSGRASYVSLRSCPLRQLPRPMIADYAGKVDTYADRPVGRADQTRQRTRQFWRASRRSRA